MKTAVHLFLLLCSTLLHPNAANPITVVPDPGFQTTLAQALTNDIRGTNWTLALTEETIRAMREVHFEDPNYDLDLEQPPWTEDTVTADDVESGRLENPEILDRVSSHLHTYERLVNAVKLDELVLMTGDTATDGDVRRVYNLVVQVHNKALYLRTLLAQTAHLMDHDLKTDHGHVHVEPISDEYEMQRRALRVVLNYRTFLGHLRGVFAAFLGRELANTTAQPASVTVPTTRTSPA